MHGRHFDHNDVLLLIVISEREMSQMEKVFFSGFWYFFKPFKLKITNRQFLKERLITVSGRYPGPSLGKDTSLLGRLLQLQRSIVCQDSDLPDELLYGRAGYLYALLYLNTEIGPGTVCESAVREVGSPTTAGILSPRPFGPALCP